MTTPKITTRMLWSALVGSMLLTPLALSASVQPEGRRGFHGGRRGHAGPGAIFRELDLSEEQRQQMRALRDEESLREPMERLRERRQALNEAVEAGADEATIRQLAYDSAEAEGDVAVARARLHRQLMEILTPEQRERYETLRQEQQQEREERRERFLERREERRHRERSF